MTGSDTTLQDAAEVPVQHPSDWHHLHSHKPLCFAEANHVHFHDKETGLHYHWNSRRHRKGRYPSVDDTQSAQNVKHPRWRFVGCDYKDISWWVSFWFLLGSCVWVSNGIIAYNYSDKTSQSWANAAAATAFVGSSIFIIGGYLSYVEALNPSRDTAFTYELDHEAQHLLKPVQTESKRSIGHKRHHFGNHHEAQPNSAEKPKQQQDWKWFGARKGGWRSLGFTANVIQFCGALIFWISTVCGFPGVLPESGSSPTSDLSNKDLSLWVVFYWLPQILGAPPFWISGIMFMIECQTKWWKPAPLSLGWHVGFWNMLGGFGFWFCGIFGIWRETSNGKYYINGSLLSTYWGSYAFLIGSYFQFFETLNKR